MTAERRHLSWCESTDGGLCDCIVDESDLDNARDLIACWVRGADYSVLDEDAKAFIFWHAREVKKARLAGARKALRLQYVAALNAPEPDTAAMFRNRVLVAMEDLETAMKRMEADV